MKPTLTLRPTNLVAAQTDESLTLRFPSEAAASLASRRRPLASEVLGEGVLGRVGAFMPTGEVVRRVEATLDRMQGKLDELKGHVRDAGHALPRIGGAGFDDRPSAA